MRTRRRISLSKTASSSSPTTSSATAISAELKATPTPQVSSSSNDQKSEVIKEKIFKILKENGSAKRAKEQTKYMKNALKCCGLSAAELDKVFKEKIYKSLIDPLTLDDKVHLSMQLLDSPYNEEKQCGIKILNKNLKPIMAHKKEEGAEEYVSNLIHQIGNKFDDTIFDWASVDTISSKVICEFMKLKPTLVSGVLLDWSKEYPAKKNNDVIWRYRACCVSFVKVARFGKHNETIFEICKNFNGHDERFLQLGRGWVLRELSLADKTAVVEFIKTHYATFSREGLRYAIEKMNTKEQRELLDYDTNSLVQKNTIRTVE